MDTCIHPSLQYVVCLMPDVRSAKRNAIMHKAINRDKIINLRTDTCFQRIFS